MKKVKGRPSPRNQGLSDCSSDWFELKLIGWRITWCHQKSKYRQLNAYLSHFRIVEIPVAVSSDTQNRTDQDEPIEVRSIFFCFWLFIWQTREHPRSKPHGPGFKITFQLKWMGYEREVGKNVVLVTGWSWKVTHGIRRFKLENSGRS